MDMEWLDVRVCVYVSACPAVMPCLLSVLVLVSCFVVFIVCPGGRANILARADSVVAPPTGAGMVVPLLAWRPLVPPPMPSVLGNAMLGVGSLCLLSGHC